MKEETLSDKRDGFLDMNGGNLIYYEKDVKEAVKKLKLRILKDFKLSGFAKFELMFKEVFGEKLT